MFISIFSFFLLASESSLLAVSQDHPIDPKRYFTFGDSHSKWSFLKTGFNLNEFPGRTMNRVARDQLGALNFIQHGVKAGDTAILAFGEVDLRHHLRHQAQCVQNKSFTDVVDDLVQRYIVTVKMNQNLFPNKNVSIILASLVPAKRAGEVGITEGRESPNKFRSVMYYYMNKVLWQESVKNGFRFFDYYPYYADLNGHLLHSMSDGESHVGDSSKVVEHLIPFLKNKQQRSNTKLFDDHTSSLTRSQTRTTIDSFETCLKGNTSDEAASIECTLILDPIFKDISNFVEHRIEQQPKEEPVPLHKLVTVGKQLCTFRAAGTGTKDGNPASIIHKNPLACSSLVPALLLLI